eukprot:GEMP01023770.1.p1 GENE.GEMP01023770.1~~GEMP01023770.1.p1  ORF type:complete len:578 (+),score=170.75 GEMP01023770.1:39-1736(+)
MGRNERDFASLLARKDGSAIKSVSALFDSVPVKRPAETREPTESARRAKKSKVHSGASSKSTSTCDHDVVTKKQSQGVESTVELASASGEEVVSPTNKHDRAGAAGESRDAQTASLGKKQEMPPLRTQGKKEDHRKAAGQLQQALRLCRKVKLVHAKQHDQHHPAHKKQTPQMRLEIVTLPSSVRKEKGAEDKEGEENRIRNTHTKDTEVIKDSKTALKEDSKDEQPAAKKDDKAKKDKKSKKVEKAPLTEEDKAARAERTVFVGNVPLDMEAKAMKKLAAQALCIYEAKLQESDVDWEVQDSALIATKVHNEECKVCVGHKLVRLGGMEVAGLKDLKKLWSSKSGQVPALIATQDRIRVDTVYFRSLPVNEKWKNKKKAGVAKKDFSNGTSKNCYVVLKKTEHKQALVMHLHKMEIKGHVLRADFNRKEDHTDGFSRKKSIFVGNLYRLTTEDELLKAFSKFPVDKVRIIRDPVTHVGRGIGFVQFENRKSVVESRKLYITLNERLLRIEKVEEEGVRKEKLREKKEAEQEAVEARCEKTPGQIRRAEKAKRWTKEQAKIAKAQ